MSADTPTSDAPAAKGGFRGIHVFWIVLATIIATVAVTYWVVRTYIYARDFTPVELSVQEQRTLDSKLRFLGYDPGPRVAAEKSSSDAADQAWLKPERYAEKDADRAVSFSERELNGMIASNKDLARKLALDLSTDMVSMRLLVPMDPDFPILGGKTLRISAGVEAAFRNGRPMVVLKGVSLMGVPIPGAWLGGLKNIDLVEEFGDQQGFWKSFADGVEDIRVEDGQLQVRLKE